jgi:hypothetical protein
MTPDEVARITAKASGDMAALSVLPETFDVMKASEAMSSKVAKALEGIEPGVSITARMQDTLSAASETLASRAMGSIDVDSIAAAGGLIPSDQTIISGVLPETFDVMKASEALGSKVAKALEGIEPGVSITDTLSAALASKAIGSIDVNSIAATGLVPSDQTIISGVLPVPTPRKRASRPVAPIAKPRLLPREVGEFLATGLIRADREEVLFLLQDAELVDAKQHFDAIEERLLADTEPSQLHAALSASLLLRLLADRLYPPRDEPWISRFNEKCPLEAKHVCNRLSAYVDDRLRSQLSTKDHRVFQATIDAVVRWTGEGHHVVRSPREVARAFRQLLEVLAMVARAYKG